MNNAKLSLALCCTALVLTSCNVASQEPAQNVSVEPARTTQTVEAQKTSMGDALSSFTQENTNSSTTGDQKKPEEKSTTEKKDMQPEYTVDDVRKHNKDDSCWTIVEGKVYDVTSWIGRHPGGDEAIRGMCGRDATKDFENQHGGDMKPEQMLSGFQIGILK